MSKEKEAERYYKEEGIEGERVFLLGKEIRKREMRRFIWLVYFYGIYAKGILAMQLTFWFCKEVGSRALIQRDTAQRLVL